MVLDMTTSNDSGEAEYFSTVAARVRGLWAALDLSLTDLAAVLDAHPETARAKLAGARRFTLTDLRLIARKAGITIGDLADDLEDDDE